MTARRTLSDVLLAQEALIERQGRLIETVLAALLAPKATKPAETVKLARGATGDHTTGVSIEVVVQEGETLEQATARAQEMYEQAAARYPLPSGYAHAYPLGPDDGSELDGAGPWVHTVEPNSGSKSPLASRKAPTT